MEAFQGATKYAMLIFFGSHIVFSLLLDVQPLVYAKSIPPILREAADWYATTLQDPLMSRAATAPDLLWFRVLLAYEFLFQVPFFFAAVNVIYNTPTPGMYPGYFRIMSLMYGGHACTSMGPILATIAAEPSLDMAAKTMLLALYLPYLIFPFWLLCLAASAGADNSVNETVTTKRKTQ